MGQSANSDGLYIGADREIRTGSDAAELVAAKAAELVVDAQSGVADASDERWQEAQRYERMTWMEHGRHAFSDRNEAHRAAFDHYAPLENQRFERGIELGCGPFTNVRFLLEHCEIDEVHLLDPLIDEYLTHPMCKYRSGRLGGLFNESLSRLPAYLRHPVQALHHKRNDLRIGGLRGRPVTTVGSMIETYTPAEQFDVVVMVNVIEHCRDARAVLAKIKEILKPGGVFVYHDKMYDVEVIKDLVKVVYDAGHPLRLDHSVVDEFLEGHFTPLLRSEFPSVGGMEGFSYEYRNLYYIGRRKSE